MLKHRFVVAMAVATLLVACGPKMAEQTVASPIEAVANDYLHEMLLRYPETETWLSLPGARHDKLFDNSPAALAAWQAREDAWLARLTEIGAPTAIGSRDWVTYGILFDELSGSVATRVCRSELWAASTATAWYNDLPPLFDLQPVGNAEARAAALQRLGQIAAYIDMEITKLRTGLDLGFSAPRPGVQDVPAEVRALLGADNPFLNLADRDGDAGFSREVREIFDAQIAPAITRYAEYIEHEYLPRAREEIAVTANPNGAECYVGLVQSFTTLAMSPEQIHEAGLQQIARIRSELQAIIDEHFGGGDIESFFRRANTEPAFTFTSEEAILDNARGALAGVRALLPQYFAALPKADVIIEPYPAYRESATGEYHASSEDGSRPGIMYLPTSHPEQRTRVGHQAFLFHETIPGHHLQRAIALELGDRVHPIARYLGKSGFVEGWALYAERLMDELGQYATPLDRIGMLSEQGARAARLVIDTGLHTQGWTRQQALDYMLANTAWPPIEVEYEINRYISWPGQANAYMLGMLEILKLRTLAQEAMGADFDIREFHARVLENGNITLPMLQQTVLAWIQDYVDQKASRGTS